MFDLFRLTVGILQKYSGNSLYIILFLLGLIYLYFHEQEKGKRSILIYGSAVLLFSFLFPAFSYFMIKKIFDDEVYYRFLWMLPLNTVIAYCAVKLIKGMHTVLHRGFVGFMIVVILIAGGDYVFDNPVFTKAENVYHIPQNVIDVCKVIEPEEGEDWVMAVFPAEMLTFVRQYSSMIHMPYGRAVLIDRWSLGHPIFETMEQEVLDVEKLASQAEEYQCDYIILPESKQRTTELELYQYILVDTVQGYLIYEDMDKTWEE